MERARDRAVQKTDDDALQSKAAAANKGYLHDAYLKYFVKRAPVPRLPLINIGTYCRCFAINELVSRFLAATTGSPRAIVSLGAGSDTRVFDLLQKHQDLKYYELDFPVKVESKRAIISANPELSRIALDANYQLVAVDLRHIRELDFSELQSTPTLLLSECCLCYLDPQKSDDVIKYFNETISDLSIALYEPISLNDEFGRVMSENLAMRGLSLPTINLYSTLESQKQRLSAILGKPDSGAVDIKEVYEKWLPKQDLQRINQLEFLDEVEEMYLLMRHYCIAWAF